MDNRRTAKELLAHVGGADNVESVTHCFTRLRFVLRDESKARDKAVQATEGVISLVKAGGQYQVVCGTKVEGIYRELVEVMGEKAGEAREAGNARETENVREPGNTRKPANIRPSGALILQKITEIFTPLIPAIAASGLIKGFLTAFKLLFARYGVDLAATDTYVILSAASQVIFYFMPIFLAMTCARAFRCNQVIAMAVGASLLYPQVDALIQDTGTATEIFGLPVLKNAWRVGDSVRVFSYAESVIPIILAILCMAALERLLERVIPEVIQLIVVPGLELLVILPLTLVVLGPVGIYAGNGIQFLYDGMMGVSTVLGGALLGGFWGVFVIFGAHRALLPIGLSDVAANGRQNLLAFAGAANFAQGGAALGVMLRTKNREMRQISASAALAATVVGVTEPAIYGCNLRLKRPMVCAVICGAVGGAIMGLGNVYGDAFANNGVLTVFTYASFGMRRFAFYLAGICAAFFGAAVLTYFAGFEEVEE